MKNTEKLSCSRKKYLSAIYRLSLERTDVKSTDVAFAAGVSKASTAAMMQRLSEEGYIEKEFYGRILLTPKGTSEARNIYCKHTAISSFLEKKLGLDHKNADSEAFSIVSCISEDTASALAEYLSGEVQ